MRSQLPFTSVPLAAAGLAFVLSGANVHAQATVGLTQYTIGTPSGDETEMLEEINRSRANPPAEGQRLVNGVSAAFPAGGSGIDLGTLLAQFQSYPARPPLAFNADLNAAAQAHNAQMVATNVLQDNSTDGTPYGTRIKSFGYVYPVGENIEGSPNDPLVFTPWADENTYEIDSGVPGYGHRLTLLEPTRVESVEIGIAQHAVGGWNTQCFGGNGTPTLLTGAVFTDNAGTGFYASGEGVASVVVTAPGASSFYAVTVESGAYTLPLDLVPVYSASAAAPTVQVVFTDALGNVTTQAVTLTHTVGTDGNSTYFNAQGQIRYDNAEADLAEASTATYPAFFADQNALGEGVYYLQFANSNFFGYYSFLSDPSFLYHFDLGYEYVIDAADGQSGVYLYDFASGGWFYTSPTFGFPYLYDFTLNSVLYYYPDPSNPGHYNTNGVRYFYDYGTGTIIAL